MHLMGQVGMGFMPSHVATVVLFALTAGIYVYVENYGRYDWTRYFTGYAGLDLRWTPAKSRMWKVRATTFPPPSMTFHDLP